ncbi:MAG: hypothetical protein KKH88_01425 [Nanoarchaeota archaeon]|nr:hypothetical protein [Nanoarchaeota archaeon]
MNKDLIVHLIEGRKHGYARADDVYVPNDLGDLQALHETDDFRYVDVYFDGIVTERGPEVMVTAGYTDPENSITSGPFELLPGQSWDVFSGREILTEKGSKLGIKVNYGGNASLDHKEKVYGFLRMLMDQSLVDGLPTRVPNGVLDHKNFPELRGFASTTGNLEEVGTLEQTVVFSLLGSPVYHEKSFSHITGMDKI